LHGIERSRETLPNRHPLAGVQGAAAPCLHVFLDTPRDYASLAFFMHSKTLQGATLRLPLPLWRTPHGDRDCIGGVKVKPKSPRSTLPKGYRMRGWFKEGVQPPPVSDTPRGSASLAPAVVANPHGDKDLHGTERSWSTIFTAFPHDRRPE